LQLGNYDQEALACLQMNYLLLGVLFSRGRFTESST